MRNHESNNSLRGAVNVRSVLWSLCMLLTIVGAGVHAEQDRSAGFPQDFAHVQQQAMELKQSVLTYSESQRRQLLRETEAALKNFDSRIKRLETSIAEQDSEMSLAAERYANDLLETLQRQRDEFDDWIGRLNSRSSSAWDELMYGYSNAFDEFYNAWENLEAEFGAGTF